MQEDGHPLDVEIVAIGLFVAGLIYKCLSKYSEVVAVTVSAIAIPVINTGVYMLGIVIMKNSVAQFLSLQSNSAGLVFTVVFALIWLNFVIEMIINILLTPVLHRVMKALKIKE